MKWLLLLLLVPIAFLGLVVFFFPPRTDPTVQTLQLTAPCPPVPASVGMIFRVMIAPKFHFASPDITEDQMRAVVQACTSSSDEQLRAACGLRYGKATVDVEAWPTRCDSMEVHRIPGSGATVAWWPEGCEEPQ